MINRVKQLFQQPAEDVTVTSDDAVEFHENACADAMAAAEERADELRKATLAAIDEVEDALHTLEDHEDDLTAVQDVTSNVVEDRLRSIEQFDPPHDIADFYEDVDALVTEWRAVTQKERLVLDRVGGPAKSVFNRIKRVEELRDEIDAFLDEEYTAVKRHEQVQDLVDELDTLQEEQEEVADEMDGIDMEPLRNELAAVEQQLQALKDDPRQDEKTALEDEIDELEEERARKQRSVEQAVSSMERGLKKLLYSARNGDTDLSTEHVQVLETIRDGKLIQEFTPPAADIAGAVTTATEALDDVDLGDRQRKKFRDGADTLQDIDGIRDDISELSDEIAAKQDELAAYTLDEEREELERKRDRIEDDIADRAADRKRLRQQHRETEQAITDTVDELENLLNAATRNNITVER